MEKKIRIGTRKSELAMAQAKWVEAELKKLNPQLETEIVGMTTTGDQILNKPLSKIGEKSLFTKELERALEEGKVDMVVHSLKDLPTTLPPGMIIGAICEREDPRDAVVMKEEHRTKRLTCLPAGSIIGTSSLRRAAQLQRRYPQLTISSVRGNLNTRLRKLDTGDGEAAFDAIVLAVAGITRMGWADRISHVLSHEDCMYAVGQGALGLECRDGDAAVLRLVAELADRPTRLSCVAERAFLRQLEGGCSVPVAVRSQLHDETLHLTGGVWSLDGSQEIRRTLAVQLPAGGDGDGDDGDARPGCSNGGGDGQPPHFVAVWAPSSEHARLAAAEKLGVDVANLLLQLGAKPILEAAKAANDATTG
ncbi:porphobilinogen deaminase-like [Pollicipes pollicipes]|uniref:porphobilinogen deaminase-like n=1 Tax=Pollicipes pollicipes TaxID=41117 RepID=UPI001884A7E6|nr:porphobilinogen deaminase-like [Pollicipes pollicipes]XP_037086438.1 porphobilinogen deaminase-like [Pollicipes pollicipes]